MKQTRKKGVKAKRACWSRGERGGSEAPVAYKKRGRKKPIIKNKKKQARGRESKVETWHGDQDYDYPGQTFRGEKKTHTHRHTYPSNA